MKLALVVLFVFLVPAAFAQEDNFLELLQEGKVEFRMQDRRRDNQPSDFTHAVDLLEHAVKLKPNNAEAHYYLGYAYGRSNSKDGSDMLQMELPLVLKASREFELVNKLEPDYTGDIYILGPYAKLTSEWGALAMSYWRHNKPDSSKWAFLEGQKRGGFGDLVLAVNRAVLDQCSKNAILISLGDMVTMPIWYLQIVEGYRRDVAFVDVTLLNAIWYPKYLAAGKIVEFDIHGRELDSLQYCTWHDSLITINDFSWTVKPTYQDDYLLRGDRVLLSMLRQNKFRRDIYFTDPYSEQTILSLKDYLVSGVFVDKFNPAGPYSLSESVFLKEITKVLQVTNKVNKNSPEDLSIIDNIRVYILKQISVYIKDGNREAAKRLQKLMEQYVSEEKYPYKFEGMKEYAESVLSKI